ncbi:prenyltransferase/squalene oxidase repeat-containing protein [Phytomonospora endophytica]|uniref:Prenyltransferase beta subunit n=1 Tax=Phytomonospora endophytica TaxID=714109 RepID=A0A841FQU7_9ACTN|nr:prenyltransferase/squalene oxidase repeat-containing protein [Phytomonospora endophytica]MBB6037203.1 prenyltransferase beta subunit [Phytomonospora endophytica]GIG71296.1 hypothetical protein Pen01_75910 [Phytomonospora endophytica]
MAIRKRRPHAREIDECLALAATWLGDAYLTGERAWPAKSGQAHPSVWGGTTDALRALIALADHHRPRPPYLPDIDVADVAEWLRARQEPSGAFASIGTPYAGAESTALVLIALCEQTRKHPDDAVRRALAFLESCIDDGGGVATTPRDRTEPRVLPTALTLWAFAVWDHDEATRKRLINHLFSCQDGTTWGWGVNSRARPNAATTAQVIIALRGARYPEAKYTHAIDFLLGQQLPDGSWINNLEEWVASPSNSVNYCFNDGTAWALTALTGVDGRRARAACASAARHILDTQTKQGEGGGADAGSWLYDAYSTNRYVWLTAQNIIALHTWAGGLPSVSLDTAANARFKAVRWLLKNAQNVVLFGLLLYVLSPDLAPLLTPVLSKVHIGWSSVRDNLISTGLWTAGAGCALWLWRALRGDRRS